MAKAQAQGLEGVRFCFIMVEAHLILATLVQRVAFELVPGKRSRRSR